MEIVTPRLVSNLVNPQKKILFLGYDETQTKIISLLIEQRCEVWHTNEKIISTAGYDLIISFGYKHIIASNTIKKSAVPIVNLHISYLPWNRGAHPNFWSFYDNTPSGVTIHLIDDGIDTGPIIFQKRIRFSNKNITFFESYKVLINEIESLFIAKINAIISNEYSAIEQRDIGSFHKRSDLPINFKGWDSHIQSEVNRLKILENRLSPNDKN